MEASLRQLETERALLQHQSADNLRKVEIEADRKRSLENECEHLGNIHSKQQAAKLQKKLQIPFTAHEIDCWAH